MKKTLKMCTFIALVLLSVLIFGKTNVYAADPVTLTQADFDAAKASPNIDTGKMKYQTVFNNGEYYNYYIMTKDNYVLGSNIDISTASIGITTLAGENVTFDLGNYSLENATLEEYYTANAVNEGVIIVINVNTNIKGMGTIKCNGYVAALTFNDDSKTTKHVLEGITIEGRISFQNTNVTINNINTKTVNFNDCNATINGGKFKGDLESAVYFYYENGTPTLTINEGTFISEKDNGIEFGNIATTPTQYAKVAINNGVFKGGMSGISIDNYNTFSVLGGTFEYTNSADGMGPIVIYGKSLDEVKNDISSNLNNGNIVLKNNGYSDYVSIDESKVTFGSVSESGNDNLVTSVNTGEKDVTPNTENNNGVIPVLITFIISLCGIVLLFKKGLTKNNKNMGKF